MLDLQHARHMRAQRRRTVTLRGVMPGCDIGHPGFARIVRLRLRDFASQKNIGSGRDGGFKITLRAPCAPCHPTDRAPIAIDQRG